MENDTHITRSTIPVHLPGQVSKEQISVRISHDVMASVDERALARNWTRTDVVEDALRREFGFGGLPYEGAGPIELDKRLEEYLAGEMDRIVEEAAKRAIEIAREIE